MVAKQQFGVAGSLAVDLVVGHDLLLGLLDDLAWCVGVAVVDALSCLSQNLQHARNHRLEVAAMAFDGRLVVPAPAALDAVGDLSYEAFGLTDDPAAMAISRR